MKMQEDINIDRRDQVFDNMARLFEKKAEWREVDNRAKYIRKVMKMQGIK